MDQATPTQTTPPTVDAGHAHPYAAAVAALDAAGVAWVRLRPRHDDQEDDLLVGSVGLAARALASVGFRPIRRLGRGSHLAVHAFDPASGRWSKVDLVDRIDLGPYQEHRTGLAPRVLERRRRVSDAWVPADDDAFWTLLLHEALDRPTPSIRRLDDLRSMAAGARVDGPGATALAGLVADPAAPATLLGAVIAGDGGPALHRIALAVRGRRRASVHARRTVARSLRWLDRRDPPFVRRGLSMALLGPDGSGKSTLARLVGEGGPLPRRSVYLGLYGGGRRGGGRSRVPGLGFLRRVLRMWRGWLVSQAHVARGRIVLLDRHPYDARLRTAGRRTLGRGLLGRALPAPDLVVVLDAPAATLYARKPEHSLEQFESQRAAYLELATRFRWTVVDVTEPLEVVARRLTARVWVRLAPARPSSPAR